MIFRDLLRENVIVAGKNIDFFKYFFRTIRLYYYEVTICFLKVSHSCWRILRDGSLMVFHAVSDETDNNCLKVIVIMKKN